MADTARGYTIDSMAATIQGSQSLYDTRVQVCACMQVMV
jgi:hypothetical protein